MRDQLVADYVSNGGCSETDIRAAIAGVEQYFADARMRGFLPILGERAPRATLGVPGG